MGGGSQDDLGCLQLPLLGKNKHPHPLIFMRGIQSNILDRGLCLMLGFTSLIFTRPGRCGNGPGNQLSELKMDQMRSSVSK